MPNNQVMVEKVALKPCPFCGGTDVREVVGFRGDHGFGVKCFACAGSITNCRTRVEAITTWNSRQPSGWEAERERLREAVRDAMADAWGEICDDTGCHPLDIRREGRKLWFAPNHWADLTALRLHTALVALPPPPTEPEDDDTCTTCNGSGYDPYMERVCACSPPEPQP